MNGDDTCSVWHPGPGFRVGEPAGRPLPGWLEGLARYATTDLSDLLNGLHTMDPAIGHFAGGTRVVGPACTVNLPAHDNLMLHKALDLVAAGDVLVVAARGGLQSAVLGGLVARKAQHRGVAGVVIDGAVRDLPALDEVGLPVFARGRSAVAPAKSGPGEVNVAVACGGVVVGPGDLIVADRDGIVAVPRDHCATLLERLARWHRDHAGYWRDVAAGRFDTGWPDRRLREAGLE